MVKKRMKIAKNEKAESNMVSIVIGVIILLGTLYIGLSIVSSIENTVEDTGIGSYATARLSFGTGSVDNYPITGYTTHESLNQLNESYGQAFSCNTTGILYQANFYLNYSGSPDFTLTADLYAVNESGEAESDAIPTGSPLATSEGIPHTDFDNSSFAVYNFRFTDDYELTNGIDYCIVVNASSYNSGDIYVGLNYGSGTHAGHAVHNLNGDWAYDDNIDTCFEVFIEPIEDNSSVQIDNIIFEFDVANEGTVGEGNITVNICNNSRSEAITNLSAAINANPTLGAVMTATRTATTVELTYKTRDAIANEISLYETLKNAVWGGNTFVGGVDDETFYAINDALSGSTEDAYGMAAIMPIVMIAVAILGALIGLIIVFRRE